LEKVEQIRERSQPVGEFLEWLTTERRIVLAQYHSHTESCSLDCVLDQMLMPCYIGIEKILAEYFQIDLEKVEQERRQLLEDVRKRGE
jgi:hypothetical protein